METHLGASLGSTTYVSLSFLSVKGAQPYPLVTGWLMERMSKCTKRERAQHLARQRCPVNGCHHCCRLS